MFPVQTVLHPTDFSEASQAALQTAGALARDQNARLVLLHVAPPPLATLGGTTGIPPVPDEYGREELMRQLSQVRPPDPAVPVEYRLEYGRPAEAIARVARELGCELVVIGTHGRTGLRWLLMGSVAEEVLRTAPCPVLTVKPAAAAA